MNQRIRELRKALGLSGEKFGANLGLTKMAISKMENGRVSISEPNIKLICSTYNVNEAWLRTGEGEMFNETPESILDDLIQQYHLDDMDIRILESFLNLSPENRTVIKDYIKSI